MRHPCDATARSTATKRGIAASRRWTRTRAPCRPSRNAHVDPIVPPTKEYTAPGKIPKSAPAATATTVAGTSAMTATVKIPMNARAAAEPYAWMSLIAPSRRGAARRPVHHAASAIAAAIAAARTTRCGCGTMPSLSRRLVGDVVASRRLALRSRGRRTVAVGRRFGSSSGSGDRWRRAVPALPAAATPARAFDSRRRRRRRGGALDDGGDRFGLRGRLALAVSGRRLVGRGAIVFGHRAATRELPGSPLGAPALAPLVDLGRRNRRLENLAPVERHVGILRLERAPDVVVERLAADLHVGRRTEPVKDPRPRLPAAVRRRLDEVEVLVAPLVAGKAEKSHAVSTVDQRRLFVAFFLVLAAFAFFAVFAGFAFFTAFAVFIGFGRG